MDTLTRRAFLPMLGTALQAASQAGPRPNILLILADDLGYSDLGCYGSEIETPNLDRLARGGVRFTQLYNSARCCPSRAALLTGMYPHKVGMGNMTGVPPKQGFPGYSGRVPEDIPFLPAVLKKAGYTTLMSGKWHLAEPGPIRRGFDEFYGMLHGFDSFWDSSKYTRLPAGRTKREYSNFYATDAITDHALDFLEAARQAANPWFLYLAYNAPHFPLHAPKKLIDSYEPIYAKGWDRLREERFARMTKLGLLDKRWQMTPRSVVGPNRVSVLNGWDTKQNPAWDALPENRRRDLARRMAVFAAMVDQMDRGIGRVISGLEASGELENTLVLFTSDNGACAEWDPFGFDISSGPQNVLHSGDKLPQMGQPGTYHSYGSAWANLSNTPWRLYKHYMHEGGISCPTIAHWPRGLSGRGTFNAEPWHFIDVLPTLAKVAGVPAPANVSGVDVSARFAGKKTARGPIFWEHEGSRAMREGKWKLTAVYPKGEWEIYDMEADRSELRNLANEQPERVARMRRQWEQWARANQVLPWIWDPAYPETKATGSGSY